MTTLATGELPLPYDIIARRGDTYRRRIRISDQVTSEPKDLTGAIVTAISKETVFSPAVLFTFTCTIDPDQVANTGELDLLIPDDVTAGFPIRHEESLIGVWDLQILYPSGDTITYLAGDVYTKGDVSP